MHVPHGLAARDDDLAAVEAEQHDRGRLRAVDEAREHGALVHAVELELAVHGLQVEHALADRQLDVRHNVLYLAVDQ